MITTAQLSAHLQGLKGSYVLWPGVPGPQCMAVFASVNKFLGGPAYAAPGAKDLWNNPAIQSFYDQIPANESPRFGDIPIWGKTWGDGWGHVAVNLEDLGPMVYAIGQNPGPAIPQTLGKDGLLGYLRPRNLTTSETLKPQSPTFTEMDIDMATPAEVVTALMGHEVTLRDGTKATLETHLVNLFGDTIKRTEVLTSFDGKTKARVIDILANLGPDVRAIKNKTDKLK